MWWGVAADQIAFRGGLVRAPLEWNEWNAAQIVQDVRLL